ncbi:MAG TPA: phospholipase A2 family protein [Leptospiraceae bacterium]|nr:phospholipase A2 family protein [Leptospiraceae bacterium]HMW04819.1 phospholipase A2 family protein [Leptospiraceae bacterium]HMX34927.1 phospholipase A2 family protein [Leptospiraceae bacterium]HMY33513.1 phospholipase A2 family protein [Leptospiraceae bacterium]HMZ66100.1 phospholipase A2 family protein [Leptospiraceae bacterium]
MKKFILVIFVLELGFGCSTPSVTVKKVKTLEVNEINTKNLEYHTIYEDHIDTLMRECFSELKKCKENKEKVEELDAYFKTEKYKSLSLLNRFYKKNYGYQIAPPSRVISSLDNWLLGYEKLKYGCYCGTGSRNCPPIDQFDKLCKDHDDCYSLLKRPSEKETVKCDPVFRDETEKISKLPYIKDDKKRNDMIDSAAGASALFWLKTKFGFEIYKE